MNALLTDTAVREIRAERARGVTLRTLADRFGVSESTVYLVAKGRRWQHVRFDPPVD